jgi:beta-barrel assembly-enhancing protease
MRIAVAALLVCLVWAPRADAQFGSVLQRAQQIRSMVITDEDEAAIGAGVSERVRKRFGVVQDPVVHKYVSLVGMVLAQASTRPNLPWKFIVLDTDGVNAFAAPGGYIHITRGALALAHDESELAGVLAHEIIHVTEKHTISAIQKNKMVNVGANETLKGNASLLNQYIDRAFDMVYAGFGRADELDSDDKGVVLANKVGYSPAGLGEVLTRLTERNKSATQKQGLFASHPEMQERITRLSKQIASERLNSTATLATRFRASISYESKPQSAIAVVEAGAAGLSGDSGGKDAGGKDAGGKETAANDSGKKTGGFGLGSLIKPSGGSEKKSAEVTGSGGSRGVDTERNARGGDDPALVAVRLTAAEITSFKKEGGLR